MSAGRNKQARTLLGLLKSIVADFDTDVEIETDEVPVSRDLGLKLSYVFTTDLDERAGHGRKLQALAQRIEARLRERGFETTKDPYLARTTSETWLEQDKDGRTGMVAIERPQTEFYHPFFRISPRSYAARG